MDSQPGRTSAFPIMWKDWPALITAGGIGTRLLPFSKEIPKEMFPIITCNGDRTLELKPVVQAIFEQLHSAGVRTFYIVVGRGKRAIEDHFSPDSRFLEFLDKRGKASRGLADFYARIRSSSLAFLNQPEPLGFGDAVRLGQPVLKGTFLVQAADTFILSEGDEYLDRLATMHHRYAASATILLQDVPDPRHYGVAEGEYLEEGVTRITSLAEKPELPKSNHAIMPVYLFTDSIFEALAEIRPGYGGEVQLTDAIQRLVIAGKPVIGVKLRSDEIRLDLGSVETMREALRMSMWYIDQKTRWTPEPESPSLAFPLASANGSASDRPSGEPEAPVPTISIPVERAKESREVPGVRVDE